MPTVLVVEDESMLRASMVRGLSKLTGVSVVAAGSVQEAQAILDATTPELVITDLNLPDGSGLEVVATLDRLGVRVPVVIASAYLRRFNVPQRAGVVLLEKPVELSRLREVVVEQLGLREPQTPFSLPDYVQLAAMGRRSVRLLIAREGKEVGEVVIHRGEAWHARDELGVGPGALSRLLELTGAAVSAHAVVGEPARNLEGSCEALLLDHIRRQDEGEADGDDLVLDDLERSTRSSPRPPARLTPARGTRPAAPPSPRLPLISPFQAPTPISNPRPLFEPARPFNRPPEPRRVAQPPPPPPAPPAQRFAPEAPARPPDPPRPPARPPSPPADFDTLYERGVEALLDRRYADAFLAFDDASRIGSSPSLSANLARLRTLGFGG